MARFEPGFDDLDEPPLGFDEPTDGEPQYWTPPVSGKAIASLVFGVMFCIPLIPSLLATFFGLLGLRETRDQARPGRGLAVSGLILGALGAVIWILLSSRVYLFFTVLRSESVRATAVAEAFLNDLADGKVDAALKHTARATPRKPLDALARAMQDWGHFDSLSDPPLPILAGSAIHHWEVEGTASFARADRPVYLRLVKDGATYHVDRFQIGGRWGVGGGRWGDPD